MDDYRELMEYEEWLDTVDEGPEWAEDDIEAYLNNQ